MEQWLCSVSCFSFLLLFVVRFKSVQALHEPGEQPPNGFDDRVITTTITTTTTRRAVVMVSLSVAVPAEEEGYLLVLDSTEVVAFRSLPSRGV